MTTLIKEKDLAIRLSVPLNWLKRLRRFYDAPAYKIKNTIYYDVDEYLKWYEDTIII